MRTVEINADEHQMKKRKNGFSTPTQEQLATARKRYLDQEPRQLFYRLAMEKVAAAFRHQGAYTLAEAIHVLLLTWNFRYYQAHPIHRQDLCNFDAVLEKHRALILRCRKRSIDSFVESKDAVELIPLFGEFNKVLKPVGTAKALHLLAPQFFPLWDNGIAKVYGIWRLSPREDGSWPSYVRFMGIRQQQCHRLGAPDALKALDEWDYVEVLDKKKSRQATGMAKADRTL